MKVISFLFVIQFFSAISAIPTTTLVSLEELETTTIIPNEVTTLQATTTTNRPILTNISTCDAALLTLDKNIADIFMIFQPDVVGYKDQEDFNSRYCAKVPTWIKEAMSYRPCLKSFPKTIFGLVIANVKKAYKTFCLNPAQMDVALKHLKCLDNSTKSEWIDIGDKITSMLYSVSDMSNINEVIPGLCCGANHLLIECKEDLKKLCASKAYSDSDEFFISFVRTLLADTLDVMCGKFGTPQKCRKEAPIVYDAVLEQISRRKKYSTTLIVPLLQVIQKLDGELNL